MTDEHLNCKKHIFPNGITVKEFKEIIKNWPEQREDGELTEIWIEYQGYSNQAKTIFPLDLDSANIADIVLSAN